MGVICGWLLGCCRVRLGGLLLCCWLSFSWLLSLGLRLGLFHSDIGLYYNCSLRLSDCLIHHGLVVIPRVFEKEVSGELFVLVASQVGLQAPMFRETKRLESLNGFHLLLGHLDLARAWSGATLWGTTCTSGSSSAHGWHTTSHTAKIRVTAHNHVHESHRVLLDSGVDLRVILLEASHELLVKLWVLTHALGHVCELRVRHQAHELGVLATWHTWHSTGHSWLARTRIFVTVVGKACISACRDLIEVNTLEEERASEVSIAMGELQCLDALVTRLACDGEERAKGLFIDTRR